MTLKAFLYVRVSSQRQEEGYSLDAQERNGEIYAARKGVEIARRWVVQESAKNDDRKAFAEMIRLAKADPTVTILLFEKTDRFTRNFMDLVRLYELMNDHGKEVHFFSTGLVLNKNSRSSEKLRLDMEVVFARNYVNNLSEEVKKGMAEKLKAGGFPGMAPIGYVNNLETHEIEPDPEQAVLVRRLFEFYATGRYTITDLKMVAQKEGLQYRRSAKPIGRSAVYHTLTNPVYYGLIRWKGECIVGKHEPLITKKLFDRVQEILGRESRPRSKKFAFRGLGECGHCGSSITAETKTKKLKSGKALRYVYYHCTGYRNGGKVCRGSYIREESLIENLGEPLKVLKIDLGVFQEIKQALRESFGSEQVYHKERLTTLQVELTKIKNRIEQAYNDRLDGVLTPQEFSEKASVWRSRQVEIQNEINAHHKADMSYLEEASRVLDLSQRAHEIYRRDADNFNRRKLVDLVVSKVVISEGRAVSNLREPFSTLSKLAVAANSGNGRPSWLGR